MSWFLFRERSYFIVAIFLFIGCVSSCGGGTTSSDQQPSQSEGTCWVRYTAKNNIFYSEPDATQLQGSFDVVRGLKKESNGNILVIVYDSSLKNPVYYESYIHEFDPSGNPQCGYKISVPKSDAFLLEKAEYIDGYLYLFFGKLDDKLLQIVKIDTNTWKVEKRIKLSKSEILWPMATFVSIEKSIVLLDSRGCVLELGPGNLDIINFNSLFDVSPVIGSNDSFIPQSIQEATDDNGTTYFIVSGLLYDDQVGKNFCAAYAFYRNGAVIWGKKYFEVYPFFVRVLLLDESRGLLIGTYGTLQGTSNTDIFLIPFDLKTGEIVGSGYAFVYGTNDEELVFDGRLVGNKVLIYGSTGGNPIVLEIDPSDFSKYSGHSYNLNRENPGNSFIFKGIYTQMGDVFFSGVYSIGGESQYEQAGFVLKPKSDFSFDDLSSPVDMAVKTIKVPYEDIQIRVSSVSYVEDSDIGSFVIEKVY